MGERIESEKKQRRSLCKKCEIALYVCAGLSFICGIYMLYYSIAYVNSYYSSYGMSMSDGIKDVLQYVVSSTGTYIGFTILFLAAAIILNRVDKISPCVVSPAIKAESQQEIQRREELKAQLEAENGSAGEPEEPAEDEEEAAEEENLREPEEALDTEDEEKK